MFPIRKILCLGFLQAFYLSSVIAQIFQNIPASQIQNIQHMQYSQQQPIPSSLLSTFTTSMPMVDKLGAIANVIQKMPANPRGVGQRQYMADALKQSALESLMMAANACKCNQRSEGSLSMPQQQMRVGGDVMGNRMFKLPNDARCYLRELFRLTERITLLHKESDIGLMRRGNLTTKPWQVLAPVCSKPIYLEVTVCQVLHQDLSNIQTSSDNLKRCTRQTNSLPLHVNGIPYQNGGNTLPNPENNMAQNLNSLPMNMATQNGNNWAFERLVQNGNNINSNGFLLNNGLSNNIPHLNNLPVSNNLLFESGISAGNNQPISNILLNGHNEQVINGFKNFNNIQSENGFINNWPSVNSNRMQNTNDFQVTNSAHSNLPGSYNFGQNLPENNNLLYNNNKMTNSFQNNVPIANALQNSFHLPTNNMLSNNNNMLFSNGINNLATKSPLSKYFPIGNGLPGIHDFQMTNGIGNFNNGLPLATNNVPFFNNVPLNGLQDPNINDPFTITGNIPLHTIVPRNVINDNQRIFNGGVIANDFSSAGRIPPNGFSFNSWPRFNNMMMSNTGPIGKNCQA
ncbi:unnamed protein product [Arctia plantaginis]|uniref:Uncharacterized protein n=1 Tax=Arctia plantaginis TaxID=874455 RepID=A0A8S1AA95_ARCPL|nr:unnamed protein product [Arctia plantaginis]